MSGEANFHVVKFEGKYYQLSEEDFQRVTQKGVSESTLRSVFAQAQETQQPVVAQPDPKIDELNKQIDADIKNGKAQKLPEQFQEKFNKAKNLDEQRAVIIEYYDSLPNKGQGTLVVGNRASKKHDGGYTFASEYGRPNLLDEDGKPLKAKQEERFEALKTVYGKQAADQEAKIDNDKTLTPHQKAQQKRDLVIDMALSSSLKPSVDELVNENAKKDATTLKNNFYEYAMTDDERNAVNTRATNYSKDIDNLIKEYESADPDRKAQIEQKLDEFTAKFNTRFPEEKFKENEHLYNLSSANKSEKSVAYKNIYALSKMLAIEDELGGREQLNAAQQEMLAKAQIKETVTHQHEIRLLSAQAQSAETSGNTEEENKLKTRIAKLEKDRESKTGAIKKGVIADQARVQTEQETYKQKYEQTTVYWDKSAAKSGKDGIYKTSLNKYARNLIQKDPTFGKDCGVEITDGSTPDYMVDGKPYKFNSEKYKQAMLKLSNSQSSYDNAKFDSDYYASTSEWADFANDHAKKGKDRPATMGERSDAREMFEIAGIQVGKDATYKMRGKKIGNAALIGAGTGALAGLGTELLEQAKKIGYSGKAAGIANDIIIKGVTGSITGPVSGTANGTVTQHSEIVEWDAATGQYVTVAEQTQQIPVSLPYEDTKTLTGNVKNYDVDFDQEIKDVDYNGQVNDKFNIGNVGIAAGVGGGLGAGLTGLRYLFKKKTEADYVNDDNQKDGIRSNTGYEVKKDEAKPVVAEESKKETIEVTEINIDKQKIGTPYRVNQEGKTIWANVIKAKYGVYNSTIYKYIREQCSGLKAGEVSDTLILPDTIPAEYSGIGKELTLDMNKKPVKTDYNKKNLNYGKIGANTRTNVSHNTSSTSVSQRQMSEWNRRGKIK